MFMDGRAAPNEASTPTIQRFLRATAYVVGGALSSAIIFHGCSFANAFIQTDCGLLAAVAAACLVPVLCGYAVIATYRLKRARTGTPLSLCTRRLLKVPIVVALLAYFAFYAWEQFTYRMITPPAERLWYSTNYLLSRTERDMREFYSEHGRLPNDLEELATASAGERYPAVVRYLDFCSQVDGGVLRPVHYVQVDRDTALLYSVGPDGDDDKGEKQFTEDLLHYHPHSRPWATMPYGKCLFEVSGVSQKIDGDIIRTISFGHKPPMPERTRGTP